MSSSARRIADNQRLLEIQNPSLAREGMWAHATSTIEKGGLLIAKPETAELLNNERMWQVGDGVCLKCMCRRARHDSNIQDRKPHHHVVECCWQASKSIHTEDANLLAVNSDVCQVLNRNGWYLAQKSAHFRPPILATACVENISEHACILACDSVCLEYLPMFC